MKKRALLLAVTGCLAIPMAGMAAEAEPADTGTWFDGLEVGTCFDDVFDATGDFDYSLPAPMTACDGLHDNEVVARVSLGDGDFPDKDLVPIVDGLCFDQYVAFLGRPIESTLMYPFSVAPDAEDWAAGAHDALCMVYAGEPVVGTAASGSLRAPGETLAVYREVEQHPDVWLVDGGSGTAVRNVTDNDFSKLVTAPAWTSDGRSIAYSVESEPGAGQWDVYLVSLQTGDSSPLLDSPADEDNAAFAPDGSTVAYISNQAADDFDIYTQDLGSGATVRLTEWDDRKSSPQWSPDGSRLAFRRRIDDVSDIWTMNADGSDAQRLTDNGGNNYDPRWSPDGSRIAFTTNQAGNFDIAMMNADGTDQHLVTTHPADDEYPTWSRDGEILAFHSTRQGGVSLWLMRTDGSEQSELTGMAPVGFAKFAPVPLDDGVE